MKKLILKYLPSYTRKELIPFLRRKNWQGKSRIFCISMQRSGTTSVGDFFRYFNFPTCSYNKKRSSLWSECWYNGDFESIFKSKEFSSYQVFEDNPWWYPDFYKVLFQRFPDAKFILMDRDSQDWFNSMLSHSSGKTLGNTQVHCKVYRREMEYYSYLLKNGNIKSDSMKTDNLFELRGFDEHYKSLYELHSIEVKAFFHKHGPESLFYSDLYEKDKWNKLGKFLDLKIPKDFDIHSHKSK